MKMQNGKSPSTGDEPGAQAQDVDDVRPDPEVHARPTRRRFHSAYKLKILEATDNLDRGEIGALLRREGLYWTNLSAWRKQRTEGTLKGLEPRKRGRKTSAAKTSPAEAKLARRIAQLEDQLRDAKFIVEVQKKVLSLCEQIDQRNKDTNPS